MITLWFSLAFAADLDLRLVTKGSFDPVGGAEILVAGRVFETDRQGRVSVVVPDEGATMEISHTDHREATVQLTPPCAGQAAGIFRSVFPHAVPHIMAQAWRILPPDDRVALVQWLCIPKQPFVPHPKIRICIWNLEP